MSQALPARPNLDWLRKTAKQQLQELRTRHGEAKLADAQLALARQYGFPSWRALKAHIERMQTSAGLPTSDEDVTRFLRHVGDGQIDDVRAMLAATPDLVHAVGPHTCWGGRAQALHVSIETKRRDMFDLLLAVGADVDGRNEQNEHGSPLMLTVHWDQPEMRRALLDRGARVGLVEAMLFEDDTLVEKLLRPGKAALPKAEPNRGSLLAFARTPFAIDRLLDLGVSTDRKDRWGATPIEAMSRLGPRGRPLVRHMLARGIGAAPQDHARINDRETLFALIDADPALIKSDAVMMGAVDFGHHDLVRDLLKRGANANARAEAQSRHTALHSAAWNGDLRMVEILVSAGAQIDARDQEHNETPRGWAQVSIRVSNNPKCKNVVDYLLSLEQQPPS